MIGQQLKLADGVSDVTSVDWVKLAGLDGTRGESVPPSAAAIADDGRWLVVAAKISGTATAAGGSVLAVFDCQSLELIAARTLPVEVESVAVHGDRVYSLHDELWAFDLQLELIERIPIYRAYSDGTNFTDNQNRRLLIVGERLVVHTAGELLFFNVSTLAFECRMQARSKFIGFSGGIMSVGGVLFDRTNGQLLSFPKNHPYFAAMHMEQSVFQQEFEAESELSVINGRSIFAKKGPPDWLSKSVASSADDESAVYFLVPKEYSDGEHSTLRVYDTDGEELVRQDIDDGVVLSSQHGGRRFGVSQIVAKGRHVYCISSRLTRVTLDEIKPRVLPLRLWTTAPVPMPVAGKQKIQFRCVNATGSVTYSVQDASPGVRIDPSTGTISLDVDDYWKLTFEPRGKPESEIESLRQKLAIVERENTWSASASLGGAHTGQDRMQSVRRTAPLFTRPLSAETFLIPIRFTVRVESEGGESVQLPVRLLGGIPKAKFYAAIRQLPKVNN